MYIKCLFDPWPALTSVIEKEEEPLTIFHQSERSMGVWVCCSQILDFGKVFHTSLASSQTATIKENNLIFYSETKMRFILLYEHM